MFSGWTRLGVIVFVNALLLISSLTAISPNTWALFGGDENKTETSNPKKTPCQFIPATTVCLVPPQGFVPATSFNGYQDKNRNAWLMVSEIAEGYEKVSEGMTTELLEKEGLQVVKRRDIYLQGKSDEEAIPAQLISIRQRVKSTEYFKWILLFGSDEKTVMVNAFYQNNQKFSKPLGEELRTILMATQWAPERKLNIQENLSFKVKAQKGLKLAQRMQNTLLYTRDGNTPNPSPNDPMFIVGRSFFENKIDDQLSFAKSRVTHFPTLKEVEIKSVEPAVIDKLNGFEITAWAKDKQTSNKIALYQMMLFDGSHYYILVGAVGANDKENYFEQFKKTAQSFKRK